MQTFFTKKETHKKIFSFYKECKINNKIAFKEVFAFIFVISSYRHSYSGTTSIFIFEQPVYK